MDQRLHNSQRLILLSVYWQWVKLTQQTCQHDSNREHHLVWGTASHNRAAAPLISSLRILMAYVKSLLWGFRCTFGWWITTRKPHQTRPQVFKLYIQILTGWWFDSTPLKNMKVSWDDYIPNIWKVIKFHGSSHHQPVKHDSNIFFLSHLPFRAQQKTAFLQKTRAVWVALSTSCRTCTSSRPRAGPSSGSESDT